MEFKAIYSVALIKSARGREADLCSVDDPGLLSVLSLRLRSARGDRMLSGSVGFLATEGEELTLIPKLEGNEGSGI